MGANWPVVREADSSIPDATAVAAANVVWWRLELPHLLNYTAKLLHDIPFLIGGHGWP